MALKESDPEIEIGETAPKFELEDYKGEIIHLEDLNNFDGVLVVFMCNHCPYVKTQIEELKKLDEEFSSVAVVGINPNSKTHEDDSIDKMKEFVEENNIEFYYLVDPEQEVAKSYGAVCTPDPFLLDWRHRLYYQGRLNDKTNPDDEINNREMKSAIEKMLKRQKPPKNQKASQGCSIKWKEKQ